IAKERGQSLAQMALSWILRDGEVTSVLIGASKPEQILENVKIVHNTSFTEEEIRRIDLLTRQ
ncbi:MAG: aldo/keto reductase, partial [Lachnospiraceae bacterium]